MGGSYSNIADATNSTYMPVAADVGRYLRATASYKDRESDTRQKSAYTPSRYPVQAELDLEAGVTNNPPSFDQDPNDTADQDPTNIAGSVNTLFDLSPSDVDVDLEIAENSPVGTNVGYPIAATDPDAEDELTYSLSGADVAAFDIDRATGQITVKRALDFEATDATTNCETNNDECVVIVTATDSTGATQMIAVTIVITNVNESPMFTRGNKAVSLDEGVTAIDADGVGSVNTYGVVDPETASENLTWSVSGVDGDNFVIANTGALSFEGTTGPDYENPADANKDNVYEITLEVSDGTNSGTLDVKVTVNNVQEDPGTVTFSHLQPRVGRSFTATLMDPDEGISAASWQWSISVGAASTPPGEIGGATSRTYTPRAGDVAGTLTATVTYTDGADSGRTAMSSSDRPVQAAGANSAPTFVEVLYERTVNENANADGDVVGGAITATNADATDVLQYSVTGTDSKHFEVDNSGMISIVAPLDYEKPADSNRDNVYRFSLVATDSSGSTGTTTVAVRVTNDDERSPRCRCRYSESGRELACRHEGGRPHRAFGSGRQQRRGIHSDRWRHRLLCHQPVNRPDHGQEDGELRGDQWGGRPMR